MHTLFRVLWFSLFCVSISGRKPQFRCDYKHVEDADGWLKFHEIPSNWNEARLRCNMEGAVLASPLNTKLKNAMTSMMNDNKVDCAVFTGIHATFSKGDYASIEGIPLSKIPHTWAKDEPDNYQDQESCLVLLPDGNMGDVKCTLTFPYFCYKKKTSALVITGCGTTDPGYELDSRTGKCYKFHRVPRTWSRAYMNCMAEGAHLAIINSETESNVVRQIFEKNPGSTMVGNFWKDFAFVGIHDWTEHGDWRTIHGQTLKEAGFDKFSGGEPNNSTTGEYCGSVYRNGMFNDLWCENKYAFICEKDPNSICDDDD